jgi:ubiquinone/menaquinone biosynthesis C-methylase UbiE
LVRSKADKRNFAARFDGKSDVYSKYRPRYPSEILRILEREVGFDQKGIVADIGSGTGILSELFLENGNQVYCVEPNLEMRRTAEKNLKVFVPRSVSVEGTAETTNLRSGSIDLIAIGQALHWFDLVKARTEFRRIIKKRGHIAIIYNHRKDDGEVEMAYKTIVDKFAKNMAKVPDVDDPYAAKFLSGGFKKFTIPNSQTLDLQGLLGRLASASYMPASTSPEWAKLKEDVRRVIDEFGSNGVATLHYNTVVYLGRISMG